MRPGHVRIIEYEILNRDVAIALGLVVDGSSRELAEATELALLRCVDPDGRKLSALVYADEFLQLLRNGEAGDVEGIALSKSKSFVLKAGWLGTR